jgi:hypothetical protein
MITSLLAFIVRLALVAAITFGFVVLFEHGPDNYLESAQAEFSKLMELVNPPVSAAPEKSPNRGT